MVDSCDKAHFLISLPRTSLGYFSPDGPITKQRALVFLQHRINISLDL